jgi:DNA-binding CsgD family transcriptional regulator
LDKQITPWIQQMEALERVENLLAAREALLAFVQATGLKNASYGVMNLPPKVSNDRAAIVTTYAQEWHIYYFQHNYIDIDPVVKVAAAGVAPVDWRTISRQSVAVRDFFESARQHGVGSQGLTLPIRGRLGEIALFSVTSNAEDAEWDRFIQENMNYLLIYSWSFHNCILRAIGASTRPTIVLSHREATCLRLKALGKTDSDIAAILQITKRTVSFHIESARSRLDAVNAVHAVAKALALGLISLSHEPEVSSL